MNLKRLVLAIGPLSLLLLAANASGPWSISRVGAASANTVFLPLISRPAPPLAVGYQFRWDGNGYIRGSLAYNVGVHTTANFDTMADGDTIRARWSLWYDPNPWAFPSETWDSYYSLSTGYLKSTTSVVDPAWKWGFPLILPFDWRWQNGQTVSIDGQAFVVSGPFPNYVLGQAIQCWKLTNRDKFLYGDWGDTKQYVNPGDVILEYDAGPSRLNTRSDILRREYYKGNLTQDTVQYIEQLTAASSFSAASVTALSRLPIEVGDAATKTERGQMGSAAAW